MSDTKFSLNFPGGEITLSTGTLAPQANASVLATWGGTVVLATVTMGPLDESKDYFPLSVEFVDHLFAGGIIKGSRWIKRDGGSSDNAILFGRIIDRAIRPLFPDGFRHEVQIILTVLSNDSEHDLVIPAFMAASAALQMSDIPFNAPVSIARVGQVDGKFVINPTSSELLTSPLDLLVCTDSQGVNMIEAAANIVDNDTVISAIDLALKTGQDLNNQLTGQIKPVAAPKVDFTPVVPGDKLLAEVEDLVKDDIKAFLTNGLDGNHMTAQAAIEEKVVTHFQSQIEQGEVRVSMLIAAIDEIIKKHLRQATLKGQRYDKRAMDEIRPLNLEVGVLPRTHGSALFQRGLTQALTVTTLDSLTEKQYLEDSSGEATKRYIHYYSAAPFSTGQTGRVGRPGRREIGHGALAEKALVPVIPTPEEFPYTIILNSEVLSQNGSSSMASTCGSTLSLMDAGVPIKDKVAGISVGMMSEGDKYVLLTDIAGLEDHFGDMDFKITGTADGITAIQLDIKRTGLSLEMVKATFAASTAARLKILDAIDRVMPAPRKQLSAFAPKIETVRIPTDKIGDVIGSGGKTIKSLMARFGVEIDVDDEGIASISSPDISKVHQAADVISAMVREVVPGEEFDGVVTRVENYGAFVEFLPGREALLHVSEMSGGFISNPSDIIKVGDKLKVKVAGFNDNRQIKLSAPDFKAKHPGQSRPGPSSRPAAESRRPVPGTQPRFGKFDHRPFPTKDRRR